MTPNPIPADTNSRDATAVSEPTRRLFFALWPDDTVRDSFVRATRRATQRSGGRTVPVHNLHATLLFLGSIAHSRVPDLTRIASRVAVSTRELWQRPAGEAPRLPRLLFDCIEYWTRPQILCATTGAQRNRAAPMDDVGPLRVWVDALTQATVGAGFAPDETVGFRPHVTLARKVARPIVTLNITPISWSFSDFALVESCSEPEGVVYRVLERFALNAASGG